MKFSKPRHHSDPSYRRDKVRLARFLERAFGVFIVEVGWDDVRLLDLLPGFYSAPFEPSKLGVFGSLKIIVATADAPMSGFTHEAGHMVACSGNIFHSNELSWLGWELQVARRARIPIGEWAYENRDYSLNCEIGGVHLSDVSEVVANPSKLWGPFSRQIVEWSKESRCLAEDGRPVFHPKKRRLKGTTRAKAVAFVNRKLAKASKLASAKSHETVIRRIAEAGPIKSSKLLVSQKECA